MKFSSYFEQQVFSIITDVFTDEEIVCQKRFPDCRVTKPLPFDFYIQEYNLVIEADGNQHYDGREYWGPTCVENDIVKNNYCMENGIQLLRIRYRKFDRNKNKLRKLLNSIRLQCRENGTANCFNCWDGGDELLPISSQADIKHKDKLTVKITRDNGIVTYCTNKFTVLLDEDYYDGLKGGFYVKDGKLYKTSNGLLAANDVLGIIGDPTKSISYADGNTFNLTRDNLTIVQAAGKVRGARGAYKTSKSGDTRITWCKAVVKGHLYESWVARSVSGKKRYFNIAKFGGVDKALQEAKSWLESEGSTTSREAYTQAGGNGQHPTGTAEGEDIV